MVFSEFKKMKYPPPIPDLAPSAFFLFGYVKGQRKASLFHEESGLPGTIREIMGEFRPKRLRRCLRDG
jgi:hypothetical protein